MSIQALRSIGTLLVALLVSLAIAEAAVRILMPQARLIIAPNGFYEPDPPGRYRLTPGYRGRITNRAEYDNEIRINVDGLRGPELEARDPGRVRILTLGDSFAFGVGVEDSSTFTALTAKLLSSGGLPTEGLNAGIPAFGVPDAVTWFELHGAELDPDVVVLSVFLGNDLIDASPDREEILVVDGLLVPAESPRGIKAWLFRNSQLYAAVKGLLESPPLRPLRSKLGLSEPWTVRVLKEELEVYRIDAAERLRPAIDATARAIERLRELAADGDLELVALLIPSEFQVDPERWRTAVAMLDLDPAEYDTAIPERIFRGLLDDQGITAIEPAALIARTIAEGESLYYRRDRHWTEKGHRLAAQELAASLRIRLRTSLVD